MRYETKENLTMFGLIVLCALMVAGVVAIIAADVMHKDKLLQQCLEDGKKAYECESMLRQPQVIVY